MRRLVVLSLCAAMACAVLPTPLTAAPARAGATYEQWLTTGQVQVSLAAAPAGVTAAGSLTFSGQVQHTGPSSNSIPCLDMARNPPKVDPGCYCKTPSNCPVMPPHLPPFCFPNAFDPNPPCADQGGWTPPQVTEPVVGVTVGIYRLPDDVMVGTTVTAGDGRYSVTLPAGTAGTHTYKAVGPVGAYATTEVTVLGIPTETSASHTPVYPALGSSVELLAVLYPNEIPASGVAPSGTVTFSEGATELCTASVITYPWDPGQAMATCPTTFSKVGDHLYTATYGGDAVYASSIGAWKVTVKHGATLRLAGAPNPSQVGQPVTFSATLTSSIVATPTGTVTFAVDQPEVPARQHEVPVGANGIAQWTTSALSVGIHKIYATYNGDANFAPTWVMINKSASPAGLAPQAAIDEATGTRWIDITHTVHWPFTGFFAPVDNNALNAAKAGSAIPVKFGLGGDQGLDIFAAGYPKAVRTSCDTGESADAVEEYVVASTSGLKYDAASGRYQYNWKTTKGVTGCYQLQLGLKDGSVHTADFQLK